MKEFSHRGPPSFHTNSTASFSKVAAPVNLFYNKSPFAHNAGSFPTLPGGSLQASPKPVNSRIGFRNNAPMQSTMYEENEGRPYPITRTASQAKISEIVDRLYKVKTIETGGGKKYQGVVDHDPKESR